jgi:hypothetical protein
MPAKRKAASPKDSSAKLGFEAGGSCGQAEALDCDKFFISLSASTAERVGVRCRSGGRLLGNTNFAGPRQESGFIHCIHRSHGETGGEGGFAESAKPEQAIKRNLEGLGYGS